MSNNMIDEYIITFNLNLMLYQKVNNRLLKKKIIKNISNELDELNKEFQSLTINGYESPLIDDILDKIEILQKIYDTFQNNILPRSQISNGYIIFEEWLW